MPLNNYHIRSCWQVEATPEELAEIAQDAEGFCRWWPATWLEARRLDSNPGIGPGSAAAYRVKGWLPYTIRFRSRIQHLEYPHRCTIQVSGDFEGRLVCEVQQLGRLCRVHFDWKVRVQKPVVRYLSFALKRVFRSNHLWVMSGGLESLKSELVRRRLRRAATRIPAL